MSLARLSVRNPVPVNLLMIAILVVGAVSYIGLPREMMSDISLNWAFIIKPYPGVSAEEIEKLITVPIEDEIRDVKGIDFIASQSGQGAAFLSVKFKQMSDQEFRFRMQDLRAEVDKVTGLPEDALDTQINAIGTAEMMPLISVHLYGDAPEKKLRELAKDLRDKVIAVANVAKVEMVGVRDREVWVEADPQKLRAFYLSPALLRSAIQARGVNVPGGKLTVGRREVIVRSVGEFDQPSDITRVIVRGGPDGRMVRVGDVARVSDTFEEERTRSMLDGASAVSLLISKQNDGNSLAITDEIKRLAKAFEQRHQHLIKVKWTTDSSEQIRDMLSKLTANAWMGFAVVVVLLFMVLGMRNAILAALGIPISFLACFIFMYHTGESFNGNSLFGLVLVLGIIVDDAIMIVENCYRHLQMGKSWKQAAIDGTDEIMTPILSATATTIAAFLPLILLPGIMGKFMRVVPVTVTLALVASMVEAFIILPSHFADWPGRKLQSRSDRGWLSGLRGSYERALRYVVQRRKRFVGCMLLVIPAAVAIIPLVGQNLFSGEEINGFQVRVTMPTGTSLDATARTLRRFEQAASELPSEEIRAVHTTAGLIQTDTDWVFRSDVGQLWLTLPLSYQRTRSTDAIMSDLRARVQRIPGPVSIELAKINTGPPVGKPVEVKVKGKYMDRLREASAYLQGVLHKIPGVFDIKDDSLVGRKEMTFRVDPERAALHGLTVGQVGLSIRSAVDGVKAGKMYDGDEELEIVVRVDRKHLDRPEALLRLPLVLKSGKRIALGDVASYTTRPSVSMIRRYKNQRAITVSANIDEKKVMEGGKKVTSVWVNEELMKRVGDISRRFPGVTLDFTGEWSEFQESFKSLGKLFLVGVLLIYVILGAQFRSYLQPVVILFTVPFAFVGAMLGLLISGNLFSIVTMFGMVALAGVAVNDAIVLISFINNARAQGMDAEEAVIKGGVLRLRPIILTSATTIAGLLPMGMGLGGMSLTWGPLANTIIWGLAVATLLTLFLIPATYLVLVHDLTNWLKRKPVDLDQPVS